MEKFHVRILFKSGYLSDWNDISKEALIQLLRAKEEMRDLIHTVVVSNLNKGTEVPETFLSNSTN
jgi:hypothetical protein